MTSSASGFLTYSFSNVFLITIRINAHSTCLWKLIENWLSPTVSREIEKFSEKGYPFSPALSILLLLLSCFRSSIRRLLVYCSETTTRNFMWTCRSLSTAVAGLDANEYHQRLFVPDEPNPIEWGHWQLYKADHLPCPYNSGKTTSGKIKASQANLKVERSPFSWCIHVCIHYCRAEATRNKRGVG